MTDIVSACHEACVILSVKQMIFHLFHEQGVWRTGATNGAYEVQDFDLFDPIARYSQGRFDPFDWQQLDQAEEKILDCRKRVFREGILRQGYTVPVRGTELEHAVLTIADGRDGVSWAQYLHLNKKYIIMLAYEFGRTARKLAGSKLVETPQFSEVEITAMQLLAKGLSSKQAALAMGIAEHTMRVYLEVARHKLQASSTVDAVERAAARGFL